MANGSSSQINMKGLLIIAAALVVGRIVLEQMGAPEWLNNVFGVAWLYFITPFYFTHKIVASGEPKPFLVLLKKTAIFAAYTRLMILPTYWLAYAFQWTAPRFSTAQGGVVGEGMTPLKAYLLIPARNALIWIVFATLVSALLGGIYLLVLKRRRTPAQAQA